MRINQLTMAGEQTESLTSKSSSPNTVAEKTLAGFGNLVKVLPSGTVFLYQFLTPLLTDKGNCHAANQWLTGVLLLLCSAACCFSSFTDSYTGRDGKLYYGVATMRGLWPFSDPDSGDSVDLSEYRIRLGDFVHALLALAVFAAVSLLDADTVACFYAEFGEQMKAEMMTAMPALGAVAGAVAVVFPYTRHGIGYPPTKSSGATSDSSD
ncbi:protein DMP2-like [Zingiber officinale]|uniref:Uncharacterized protein n=1 Tax=Zingiber officinale TaxID=94328 RepID=A0A8J5HH71_ZINOF|nr:protein DMP2-like [Zingiber officinale]KAG6521858.1 hypothetical protein ZIOFF_018991 [Zingiber officinale]